jgi:hypothetical protein
MPDLILDDHRLLEHRLHGVDLAGESLSHSNKPNFPKGTFANQSEWFEIISR